MLDRLTTVNDTYLGIGFGRTLCEREVELDSGIHKNPDGTDIVNWLIYRDYLAI